MAKESLLERIGRYTVNTLTVGAIVGLTLLGSCLCNARRQGRLPIKAPVPITAQARAENDYGFNQNFTENLDIEKYFEFSNQNGRRTVEFLTDEDIGYRAFDSDGDNIIDRADYITEAAVRYGNVVPAIGGAIRYLRKGAGDKTDEKWEKAQMLFDIGHRHAQENEWYVED